MKVFAVFINRAAPAVGCVNFLHFFGVFLFYSQALSPLSPVTLMHTQMDARKRGKVHVKAHTNTHALQVWPPLGSRSLGVWGGGGSKVRVC